MLIIYNQSNQLFLMESISHIAKKKPINYAHVYTIWIYPIHDYFAIKP